MKLGLFTFVLLICIQQSLCEATETSSQNHDVGADHGFIVEYTLITANSPDCVASLVDKFPVRVQYRTIIGDDGGQSNTSVSEWMDSPNLPGMAPFTPTNLAQYVFSMGPSRPCLVSPIEVVQNNPAKPSFVAVYTASCNRTGPTY